VLELDGRPIGWSSPAARVALDPGEHLLLATAPGHRAARLVFRIAPADEGGPRPVEVRVPPLVVERRDDAPAEPEAPSEPLAIAGAATAVTGGVTLGVGLVLGAIAVIRNGQVEDRCPERGCDDQATISDAATNVALAHASTGLVVGGLALGAIGVTMFLAAPTPDPARGVGGAQVAVRARWP
jgi:hypothetical protein